MLSSVQRAFRPASESTAVMANDNRLRLTRGFPTDECCGDHLHLRWTSVFTAPGAEQRGREMKKKTKRMGQSGRTSHHLEFRMLRELRAGPVDKPMVASENSVAIILRAVRRWDR